MSGEREFRVGTPTHEASLEDRPEQEVAPAPEVAGLRRIEDRIRELRQDGLALRTLLDGVQAAQRQSTQLALIRVVGATRATELCAQSWGMAQARFPMVPSALPELAPIPVEARVALTLGHIPRAPGAAVQLKAAPGTRRKKKNVRAEAERGVTGSGGALPYQEMIQHLFGRHDIGGIRAHVGTQAADAARAIGARAYTVGDDVAFGQAPELYTAAHEAAHVVQQRAGVTPAGGIGEVGDALERQADAAADAVVSGRSAEAILDPLAARGAATPSAHSSAVQRLEGDYSGLDPVAAVAKAMDDDEEEDAFTLIDRLTTGAQATDVLDHHQEKAVDCFDNDEMAQAVKALVRKGGRLEKAMDWLFDEGTSYNTVVETIRACADDTMKGALRTPTWRTKFADEFDGDEVAVILRLLGVSLVQQLQAMRDAGTSWEELRDAITSTAAADRPAVYASDLLPLFVSKCGDAEMRAAVELIGGTVRQKLKWIAAEGCDDPQWAVDLVTNAPVAERVTIHAESTIVAMVKDFDKPFRLAIVQQALGTPQQQLTMLGEDTPISDVTWATPDAAWVSGCIAAHRHPHDLLDLAKGDPATWGPLIGPRLWDLLGSHEDTLFPDDRVAVFWAAYDSSPALTAPQIVHFYKLLTGREIQPPGEFDVGDFIGIGGKTYTAVMPDVAAIRDVMNIIKPGGSSGATGIGRAELGAALLAFCSLENGVTMPTSYYWNSKILLRVSPTGQAMWTDGAGITRGGPVANSGDGTPGAVGSGLTYFQNHVRHEIGHAVGCRTFGDMDECGDDMAEAWGGWEDSSESEFLAAMWAGRSAPGTGWPTLGGAAGISDEDARDWCVGLLDDNEETDGPVKNLPGNIQAKLALLAASLWGSEKLVKYLQAIGANSASDMRDNAYEYPNFTPTDPAQIYCTRWGNTFRKYDKFAHDAFMGVSWYALSSYKEMFAEMYTARYSTGLALGERHGKNPTTFFTELEAARDPMFGD